MAFELWKDEDVLFASKLNLMLPKLVTLGSDITIESTAVQQTVDLFELPFEAGATYNYELFIAYSASTAADFVWNWLASEATFSRYAFYRAPGNLSGLNVGATGVIRRPAQGTQLTAQGGDASGTTDPLNFMSAYDRGTFTSTGSSGTAQLQFTQSGTGSTQKTILRGGNGTRVLYQRIA